MARGRLRVAAVVVARFEEGAGLDLARIGPGEGLLGLLDNTVAARRRPEDAMEILGRVVRKASCWQARRGDAARVTGPLLDLLRGETPGS